jgi:uncharacterized protein (TIGR01244 family)
MRNARKIDESITIGQVPDRNDLAQLKEIGFRKLVDVREEDEKSGERVEAIAREIGLNYESVPISRDEIHLDEVLKFYSIILERSGGPYYAFSQNGRKPLAFQLLLDAVVAFQPLGRVFQRASRIGIDLRGDLALQSFLIDVYSQERIGQILEVVRQFRPELLGRRDAVAEAPALKPAFEGFLQRHEREATLGQKGCTIWLTGLPCAGKSTTAFALEKELTSLGFLAYVLDSDNIRHGLSLGLGFRHADRTENIRRVGQVAKLFADAGLVVITSFISPYQKDRDAVRGIHADANLGFVEVFVDTPPELCEQRDRTGLYARARRGELAEFTGVSDPYEQPIRPEVVVKPAEATPEEIAAQIVTRLRESGHLLRTRGSECRTAGSP